MAWSTPRSWVAGEMVTASLMNSYLRDQLNHAVPTVSVTDIAFSAGNFTGLSGMTWTVASGDVEFQWAYRSGDRTLVAVGVITSTIGGTPSPNLRVAFPGFSWLRIPFTSRVGRSVDNGTPILAGVSGVLHTNQVGIFTYLGTNWTASTDNTLVQFVLDCH